MKAFKWIFFFMMLLSCALLALPQLARLFLYFTSLNQPATLAIIGSADGPTTVFVASYNALHRVLLAAMFIVSLLAWLFFKEKTKAPK